MKKTDAAHAARPGGSSVSTPAAHQRLPGKQALRSPTATPVAGPARTSKKHGFQRALQVDVKVVHRPGRGWAALGQQCGAAGGGHAGQHRIQAVGSGSVVKTSTREGVHQQAAHRHAHMTGDPIGASVATLPGKRVSVRVQASGTANRAVSSPRPSSPSTACSRSCAARVLAVLACVMADGLLARINSFFRECSQPTSSVTVTW